MKFVVNTKQMEKALTDIQGKGKYLGNGGLSSSKMGSYFYMTLTGDTLDVWNGDATFGMNITIAVTGVRNGSFIGDAQLVIPYLKKFGEGVLFESDDYLRLTSGSRKASLPMVINHPNMDAITRIRDMIKHISYQENIEKIWSFGSSKFEGAFMLNSTVFKEAIGFCELVKSGVYKLNYDKGVITFSSTATASNKYEQSIEISSHVGESATLEYSGPLHNFFEPSQPLNFYVKDEFPLLIVGADRKILKAPYNAGGN